MTKKAWDELLQAALLGTVRAGWSAAQLPAVVLEKIPGNHTDESENLLSAIALS